MGSRLRKNPSKLFDVFVEVARPTSPDQMPFVLQKHPESYNDVDVLKSIPQFVFPCDFECPNVDHFTFVLTDIESRYKFGFCRYATRAETCICIVSCLPWYEIFYKLLNYLADVLNRTENNNIEPILSAILQRPVPSPEDNVEIISSCCKQSFTFTCPDPEKLPVIPENRNLTEYYTAVDVHNMMVIFASMLYERRILVTSRRMSRLTACVHGSAALIYPMYWQHLYIPVLPAHLLDYCSAPMPFLIGIHSNLMTKTKSMELGDVVILDADNNTVITEYDDLGTLPQEIVSTLKKRLKGQQADKVKTDSQLPGDGVARAFLQALAGLIGGYRDALRFVTGKRITFEEEKFIMSRPPSMQPFLEKVLQLQTFEQFIHDRLEMLNSGMGFNDEFETEANAWSDRAGTNSKYKEWLTSMKKQGKRLRREGKDKLLEFRSKANPAVKSAVKSVKDKGKKAYKDFRTKFDDLKKPNNLGKSNRESQVRRSRSMIQQPEDDELTSVLYHSSRTSHTLGRERPHTTATTLAQQLRPSRPPRPPPPDRPRTIGVHRQPSQSQQLAKIRQYKLMSLDDMSLDHVDGEGTLETPARTSIRLLDDPEIQLALKKSYSLEDIMSKAKEESLIDEDEEGVFSDTESSESEEGVQIIKGPPVPPPRRKRTLDTPSSRFYSSETGSDTSGASLSHHCDEFEDHPPVPPRRTSSRRYEQPLIDLNSPESEALYKKGAANNNQFEDNFVSSRALAINQGLPSLAALKSRPVPARRQTPEAENAVQKLRDMYIRLEESKNMSPEHDVGVDVRTIQSQHFGNVQRLKAKYMGVEDEVPPKISDRSSSARSSIVQRSPAFKRNSVEKPEMRRSSLENTGDMELFDPLSSKSNLTNQPTSGMNISADDVNLLKDWSLNFTSLASTSNSSQPTTGSNFMAFSNTSNNRTVPSYNSNQTQNLFVQTDFRVPAQTVSTASPTRVTKRPSPSGSPSSVLQQRVSPQQFIASSPSPPIITTASYPTSSVPASDRGVFGRQTSLGATTTKTPDPFGDLVDLGQMKSTSHQKRWEQFE